MLHLVSHSPELQGARPGSTPSASHPIEGRPAPGGRTGRLPIAHDPTRIPRVETERRILEVAEEAFLSLPADQVRVGDVARDAGVSVGTVYLYFGSKAGLQAAVVEDVQLEVLQYTMVAVERPGPATWDDVVDYCVRWERVFRRDRDRSRLIATLDLTEPADEHAATIRDRIGGRFGSAILQAGARLGELVDRGEVRPCEPAATAAWIYSTVAGTMTTLLQLPAWLATESAAAEAFARQRMMVAQALLPPERLAADGTAPASAWGAPATRLAV
ncbi:MAG: TetR/AcrR family transcriptional regulator [Solirubrobacteraceae bacterium]|nr:TetR/AcrR family transcriptional regulator [Solirubrobacteraceae bacterium]